MLTNSVANTLTATKWPKITTTNIENPTMTKIHRAHVVAVSLLPQMDTSIEIHSTRRLYQLAPYAKTLDRYLLLCKHFVKK